MPMLRSRSWARPVEQESHHGFSSPLASPTRAAFEPAAQNLPIIDATPERWPSQDEAAVEKDRIMAEIDTQRRRIQTLEQELRDMRQALMQFFKRTFALTRELPYTPSSPGLLTSTSGSRSQISSVLEDMSEDDFFKLFLPLDASLHPRTVREHGGQGTEPQTAAPSGDMNAGSEEREPATIDLTASVPGKRSSASAEQWPAVISGNSEKPTERPSARYRMTSNASKHE